MRMLSLMAVFGIWLLPAVLPGHAVAQEQKSMLSLAEEHYAREEYSLAIPLYEDIVRRKHGNAFFYRRLANCYQNVDAYKDAAEWYGKLTSDTAGVTEDDWFRYGETLKWLGRYSEAKAAYAHCHDQRALSRMAGCDSATAWMGAAPRFTIKNMEEINTSMSDWGAVGYLDRYIVFTSDSLRYTAIEAKDKVNARDFGKTGTPFLKLYRLDTTVHSREFGFIYGLGGGLNESKYHVGPIAFTRGYDTAFVTVTNPSSITYNPAPKIENTYYKDYWRQKTGHRRLMILTSVRKNGNWGPMTMLPIDKPDSFSVGHAALSPSGDVLYFTSDMPGGKGGTDIWFVERLGDSAWGTPHNCGDAINTSDDEAFPTMGQDGTLYFASKGLPGMGGYDVFSAHGSRDQWTEVQNLGVPVNSAQDDFYFKPGDSARGYFSSNRVGGRGSDDIYAYALIPPPPAPKKTEIAPAAPAALPAPAAPAQPALHVGDVLVLKDLYYDYNQSNIRPDAARVLDSLAGILKSHPTMRIALQSHTDARGNATYNLALSERRAKSAVDYLVSQGIAPDRLEAKGFGSTHLVNGCRAGVPCSEAGHQANRRTEVKILHE